MAINLAHKSITIDVNNRNAPNVVGIVNINDKATRYLDVILTASGEKLTFTDCTATATFATDGYLISDSVACTLNSTADVITVPLEDFKSMSGFLAIEIKIANGETQVLNTPLTLKVMVTPSLAENSKINSNSAGSFVEISREVVTARGGQNSLGARLDTADANLANKADKSTTLAGYGITDAYTKERTDQKLAQKLNSMPFDNEPKQNSPCYLTSGTVYNSLLTKADKTETDNSLGEKADKADVDDVKAFVGYTDDDIVGLCVDYENKTFKRLAGAVGLSQGVDFNKFEMYGGRKRCNVSDNGTITAYYGDENYAEDGSNGQVMVYQPAFYYKVVPLKLEKNSDSGIGYHLRKANYYVSSKPKTGFKLHPAFYDENGNEISYILFSADEGSMYDVSAKAYVNDNVDESITYEDGDLLCSVAGKKPISGLRKGIGTKANLELMAQNRGSGWHLETIKATSANQLLMMTEIGIMSTQNGIGQGVVSISDNSSYNCSSLTGSTAELGNGTGSATETINEKGGVQTTETASGKVSVSYRGVENLWGNLWKHIQGINIWGDGTMCGGQPYIANDFTFNESTHSDNYEPVGFTLANASGFINAMGYGGENYDWLLMPSEIGGTNALPVGDYFYAESNLNGYRITRFGGCFNNFSQAGGFNWRGVDNASYRSRVTGGRLVYIPTAKSGDTPTKTYSTSEVDALLATKYDSSNIESGTSKLTPYSTITDKIKNASCTYKTIGDIVIVSATVKMNAVTIGANSSYPLIDLPYKCIAVDDVFCVGISNLGKIFKFVVPKNNTWLQFQSQDKTAYAFADGEQINVICLYKIK